MTLPWRIEAVHLPLSAKRQPLRLRLRQHQRLRPAQRAVLSPPLKYAVLTVLLPALRALPG
jgi:hypothetical protein